MQLIIRNYFAESLGTTHFGPQKIFSFYITEI